MQAALDSRLKVKHDSVSEGKASGLNLRTSLAKYTRSSGDYNYGKSG